MANATFRVLVLAAVACALTSSVNGLPRPGPAPGPGPVPIAGLHPEGAPKDAAAEAQAGANGDLKTAASHGYGLGWGGYGGYGYGGYGWGGYGGYGGYGWGYPYGRSYGYGLYGYHPYDYYGGWGYGYPFYR